MENTNSPMPAGDSAAAPKPEEGNGPAPAAQGWSMPNDTANSSEPVTPSVSGQPVADSWNPPEHIVGGTVDTPPTLPAAPETPLSQPAPGRETAPIGVVQVLSTRGVEYTMMMLCLWLAATARLWVLLALLNGGNHFDVMAFPVSLMVVCVPVFGWFFLRLKKAELADPQLRFDPSKRRLTQFTQVIAFAACLFNLIAFVYLVFTKMAGHAAPSLGKSLLNLAVILLVAGGILAYYWNDEHRG